MPNKKIYVKYEQVLCIVLLLIFGLSATGLLWSYHVTIDNHFKALGQYSRLNTQMNLTSQTYTNETLGYSLSYPKDWQVQKTGKEIVITNPENENVEISIKNYSEKNLSLLEWINQRIEQNGRIKLIEDGKIKIADTNGMYIRQQENEMQNSALVYFNHEGFVYEIKLLYPVNNNDAYYKLIFNKITSSFKF